MAIIITTGTAKPKSGRRQPSPMTKTTTVQLVDFTICLVCESLVMRPCLIAEFASPAINDSNRTSRFGRFGVQVTSIA